jgi:hypothetical protein
LLRAALNAFGSTRPALSWSIRRKLLLSQCDNTPVIDEKKPDKKGLTRDPSFFDLWAGVK